MSRSLNDLVPEMKIKAENVRNKCRLNGVDILIYYTLRSLKEQAILYRQSWMDSSVIQTKIDSLKAKGFDFLAKILVEVGPQKYTGWVTSAAPGESYHNYGMAIDAVPLKGNEPLWNYKGNEKEWDIYGEAVESEGLTWGGRFKRTDMPHAQLTSDSNPLRSHTPEEIRKMLKI